MAGDRSSVPGSRRRKRHLEPVELPVELAAAIDHELKGSDLRAVRAAAERLSLRYRTPSQQRSFGFVGDDEDVTAYIAVRMPATYTAAYAAMSAVAQVLDGWTPRTLLDVGAGAGATSWAALDAWPDIQSLTLLDRNGRMIAAGERLARFSRSQAMLEASWVQGPVDSLPAGQRFDLVVAGYVLNEIPSSARPRFVERLWTLTAGVLILIEPGTPSGFETIREIRKALIEAGSHVIAPCPHNRTCPMAGQDWCHFAARLNRSRAIRFAKTGDLSHEDEKFSYVAMRREAVAQPSSRIIRHPQYRRYQVFLDLCSKSGRIRDSYSRRSDAERYRKAREARWGDAWELDGQ